MRSHHSVISQPRLADARLADDERKLAFPGTRALPAPAEKLQLLFAADKRRESARPAAPAAAARAHDAEERHGRRHALERMRALVLGDEQAGGLALHGRGDEHRPGLGCTLHTRRDVRRIAEHLARSVDHDGAHVEADGSAEGASADVLHATYKRLTARSFPRAANSSLSSSEGAQPLLRPLHLVVRETDFCGQRLAGNFGAECGRTVGIRFADRKSPH